MRGRLMFHPAQPDREYSLGFNHECDFLVPHGLGIFAGALHLSALPVIIHAWPEASSRLRASSIRTATDACSSDQQHNRTGLTGFRAAQRNEVTETSEPRIGECTRPSRATDRSSSSSDEEWHPNKRADGAISSIEAVCTPNRRDVPGMQSTSKPPSISSFLLAVLKRLMVFS